MNERNSKYMLIVFFFILVAVVAVSFLGGINSSYLNNVVNIQHDSGHQENTPDAVWLEAFKKKFDLEPIASTFPTPIPELVAVPTDRGVFYVSKDMNTIIAGGHMLDASSDNKDFWVDLTANTLSYAYRIDVHSLPKDNAIVFGHGPNRMILFSDPDCPYCRSLERVLSEHEDMFTVEAYLFPLENIHPNAMKHSLAIMCSKNKRETMHDIMVGGKDASPKKGCNVDEMKKLIKENLDFALKNHIGGTPTIYAENGLRYIGPNEPEAIAQFLIAVSGKEVR